MIIGYHATMTYPKGKIRCGEGFLIDPQLSVQTTGLVVPTRTPLSLLIHLDITQETDTLSRLQKDYSSHPQEFPVGNSKNVCGRVEKSNKNLLRLMLN